MYLYLPLPIRIIPGLTGEGLFRHGHFDGGTCHIPLWRGH